MFSPMQRIACGVSYLSEIHQMSFVKIMVHAVLMKDLKLEG